MESATIVHKLAVLKQHCGTLGRDYEGIRRYALVMYLMADSDERALASLSEAFNHPQAAFKNVEFANFEQLMDQLFPHALIGSPETIRRHIAAYEAAGVQEMRIVFLDDATPDTVRRFAKELMRQFL